MKKYNLAFLGFGNVARALVQLLDSKRAELRERYEVEFAFTGVASRRLGWHANPTGFTADDLIGEGTAFTNRGGEHKPQGAPDQTLAELRDWLAASQANVLFENTSMNPYTGQPAIDYVRTALRAGIHVVTANKGPVVHAYHELRDLAAANHVRFLHEAAVTLAHLGSRRRCGPAVAAVASAGVGRPYKLVCQAEKLADGTVVGSVQPEQVPLRR